MGRAAKWFRSLFTSKNSPTNKNKWPLSDSSHTSLKYVEYPSSGPYADGLDANHHAIAVAAATAAVAEAAVAAAQAAAQVVRLTSGRTAPQVADRSSVLAAVKIQSAFRAYLARRALRALRGLVKLQALVRGRIVRKQSADMLFRMQTMAKIQARASAQRSHARYNFSTSDHTGMPDLGKSEESMNTVKQDASLLKQHHSRSHMASRWLNQWMEQCAWNDLHENMHYFDERNDKILEVDTWNPASHYFSAWNNELAHDHSKIAPISSNLRKPNRSISSEEARTADNSPRLRSASSRPNNNVRGPSAPARSECSSVYGDYFSHPTYMANTKSSRAKVRSYSTPKQRMVQYDLDTISEKGCSQANRGSNAYIYRGLVKRQGAPRNNGAAGLSRA